MILQLQSAIQVERLKLKRTLALWLTLLTPGALVFIEVAAAFQRNLKPYLNGSSIWVLLYDQILSIWAILMLPLFITLETALLAGLEHNNQTWKQLYTQPIPRWIMIVAKQVLSIGLIALSMVLLLVLSVFGGLLLHTLKPEVIATFPIPWIELLRLTLMPFLASACIIMIHNWVALRWGNFVVASGFGILMTVSGIIFTALEWAEYHPWMLPALATHKILEGVLPMGYILASLIGGFAVLLVGNWALTRREVFE
jgi:hypothetical protein